VAVVVAVLNSAAAVVVLADLERLRFHYLRETLTLEQSERVELLHLMAAIQSLTQSQARAAVKAETRRKMAELAVLVVELVTAEA
jgi:hypothetical protein